MSQPHSSASRKPCYCCTVQETSTTMARRLILMGIAFNDGLFIPTPPNAKPFHQAIGASKTRLMPSSPAVTIRVPSPCTKANTPPPSPSPLCPFHSRTKPEFAIPVPPLVSHLRITPSIPQDVNSHPPVREFLTNSTFTTEYSSCASLICLRTANRCAESKRAILPSTLPAARRVSGGGANASVSMPSVCA